MNLVCWKCGAALTELPLPLSRLAECPKCRAYQHACRMCGFYDARLTSKCREERAEEVRDKEHANFCDWFKPRPNAYRPPDEEKNQIAKAQLGNLFSGAGDVGSRSHTTQDKLDEIFGSSSKSKK